jgi:spoIIIJ-associated protein
VNSAEGTGRTVEEAIREALRILGVGRDEVDLIVLDEGSRGMLGLGARPAHVRLTLLSEAEGEAATPPAREEGGGEEIAGADAASAARSVASSLVSAMGFHASVNARLDAGAVRVSIAGTQLAPLIGRHGQTLEALELLVSLIVARRMGHRVLLSVDVERYRERRRQALQALAQRTAGRVRRAGAPVALEPMSASERRVVHTTLAQDPAVTTHSEGEGAERHVVISPREELPRGSEGLEEDDLPDVDVPEDAPG